MLNLRKVGVWFMNIIIIMPRLLFWFSALNFVIDFDEIFLIQTEYSYGIKSNEKIIHYCELDSNSKSFWNRKNIDYAWNDVLF